MSSVTVNIILQGLIAFSPHYDGDMANRMTALAVDSRLAPANSACIVDHMPMVEFPSTSANCTAFHGCEYGDGKCMCPLDRQEITLLPDAEPTPSRLSREAPAEPMPETNANDSAGDFSYIAHFSSLGYELDPRFLEAAPPAALAARFTFPFDSLLACDHATRPDNLAKNVHSFQFHKLGALGKPEQLNQAVAQVLVAKVNLDTSSQAPILRLTTFGGGVSHDFPLKIGTGNNPVKIRLMNHRPSLLSLGDSCDDGIARDFALFYELVQNPPAWSDRLLPHVKFTSWKNQVEVDPVTCPIDQVPMSRPACPPVAF